MKKYTLGIDIGTTSICAAALGEDGKILSALNAANSSQIKSPESFARMQDPGMILDTVYSLIGCMEDMYGIPTSVGITGQMHGILYTDADGNAVSPLYTWQDARGAQPMKSGGTYASHIKLVTGYRVAAGYGLVTHFYNLQNGLVPETAVSLCTIHDYAAMRLSGIKSPVVHVSDAASLGLYDLYSNRFDLTALDALGIGGALIPKTTTASDPIGTYKGAPVYPAIGDNQASFLGSVGDEPGTLLINVGTGSQVSMIGTLRSCADGIECRPFINGRHLLVGSSLCGGRAYATLEKFFREVANMCGANISSAYPFMDKLMESYTSADHLTVSTIFDGTRADPDIRGSITGISTENLTAGAVMEGFMYGIADELYRLYLAMGNDCSFSKLAASGNGLRSNPYLCRVIEKVFASELVLTDTKEEAAVGAARFASGT